MPLKRSEIEKLKQLHMRLMTVFRQLSSNACQFDQVMVALNEFTCVSDGAYDVLQRYHDRIRTLEFQLAYAHMDAPNRLMKIAIINQYKLTILQANRIIFNKNLKGEMQRALQRNYMLKMTTEHDVEQPYYALIFLDKTVLQLHSLTDTAELAAAKEVFMAKIAELKSQHHSLSLFHRRVPCVVGFTNDINVDMSVNHHP